MQVLEVAETNTALEARSDFGGVVLEALERGERAVPDDGALSQEANLVVALDRAVLHETTSNQANTLDAEDLADLGLNSGSSMPMTAASMSSMTS